MAQPDYGSTIGFIVFVHELALLVFLLAREFRALQVLVFAAETTAASATSLQHVAPGDDVGSLDNDDRFLFDVVVRRYESIVQNIDALDNGLIAVAIGIAAVTLFAADKWVELSESFRIAGAICLVESAICSLGGYLTVYCITDGTPDVVRLADFAVDFGESPIRATREAVWSISLSTTKSVAIRRYKRVCVVMAMVLVILAAAVIAVGRARGAQVVH